MPAERQPPDAVAEQHEPEQRRLHRLGPGEGVADREVAQREQVEQQHRPRDSRQRPATSAIGHPRRGSSACTTAATPDSGGEDHQAHREQQDRSAVGREVDERRLQCGGVEQRGQQAEQRHLRAELDGGDERQHRRHHADRDQQQGWREPDPPRHRGPGEDHRGERHQEDRDLHGLIRRVGKADSYTPRMVDGEQVERHVAAFGDAVAAGGWEAFSQRFAEDAEMVFVGVPAGPFVGRAAIAAAYAADPAGRAAGARPAR